MTWLNYRVLGRQSSASHIKTPRILAGVLMIPILLAIIEAHDLMDVSNLGPRGVVFEREHFSGIREGASNGDFNGDGFADLVIDFGMSLDPTQRAIGVIQGGPGIVGRLRPDESAGLLIYVYGQDKNSNPRGYFIGDVNSDGLADLWIAFVGYVAGEEYQSGAGAILFGSAHLSGPLRFEEIGKSIPGIYFRSSNPDDPRMGWQPASLRDCDGDGQQDFALGMLYSNNLRGESSGAVVVVSDIASQSGFIDVGSIGLSKPGIRIVGSVDPEGRGNLGFNLADAGDFDGDAFSDLLALSRTRPQTAYLIRGRPGLSGIIDLYDLDRLDNVTAFIGRSDGLSVGSGLAGLGDLNGDSFDDVLITLSRGCCGLGGEPAERTFVIYGTDAALPSVVELRALEEGLDNPRASVITPIYPFSVFGYSASGAGDLNLDGVPDILIGAPGTSVKTLTRAGEAYAIFAEPRMPPQLSLAEGFSGIRVLGEAHQGWLGDKVQPAGDFNADGAPDIFILAPSATGDPTLPNRAYVLYGTGSSEPPFSVLSLAPARGYLRGGTSVAIAGSGFQAASAVTFGSAPASRIVLESSSLLRAFTPPGAAPGKVDVAVTVDGVTRFAPGGFEYTPNMPSWDLTGLGKKGLVVEYDHSLPPTFPVFAPIEFLDVTRDGVDDLIVESPRQGGWVLNIVRGGDGLPATVAADAPSQHVSVLRSGTVRRSPGATLNRLGDIDGGGSGDLGIGTGDGFGYLLLTEKGELTGETTIEELEERGQAVQLSRTGDLASTSLLCIVALGDLTGDGVADFAVSHAAATAAGSGLANAGEIAFVAGQESWEATVDLDTSSLVWARLEGARSGQRLGGQLRQVGDVNGDGLLDLLADSGVVEGKGRAFLVFGTDDLPEAGDIETHVQGGGGAVLEIDSGLASIPVFVVSAGGDIDGDGLADCLVGVEGGGAEHQGITYVVRGGASLPAAIPLLESGDPGSLVRRVLGEGPMEFAGRPGPAGDFDGDGFDDFLVGAPGFQHFGVEAGNVFLVFGAASLPASNELASPQGRVVKIDGRNVLGGAGFVSGPAGDLNADGYPDFAFSENGVQEGASGYVYVIYSPYGGVSFVRGDANFDGEVNISDAIFTLTYLFLGGTLPLCHDAADADDSGRVEITDAIRVLGSLFVGDVVLPEPFPVPGPDPSADTLDCTGF